jgi:hypothetical protein
MTPADAGVQPPYTGDEEFGRYVVSGDFNRDGHADLAVSTPGRDIVAVISGTAAGLAGGKVRRITPSGFRLDPGEGRFGSRMLAADMNRDRFDDLVVGAPDSDRGQGGSGIIQILFGGPRGLGTRVDSVVRPTPSLDAFGTALRTGDLNRDGKADLVEGAPDEDTRTGHLSYCLGARRGPGKCNTLTGPVSSGTSGLAVADVDGDRYDDIVQGDAIIEPAAADRGILGGEVRVWLGSRHGPVDHPQIITQATPRIPSDDEAGDRFGTSIGAADLDHDGYDDMVVSAPGEDGGDGAVTVIRGGAEGHASAAHTIFSPGNGLPVHPGAGEEVGWALVVMDISGNRRPDVITLSHHAQRLEDAVLVIEGGKGAYAAGETHVWRALRGSVGVADPAIARIRIGRGAEG